MKLAAVRRLTRGESLEALSRELNLPAHRLSEGRDRAPIAAESALKEREREARDEDIERRIMKTRGLLARPRPSPRAAHPHDGTIATARADETWGSDMTETATVAGGHVFVAVDRRSGEVVGTHAASRASRREALEPIGQGAAKRFRSLDAGAAAGLAPRHDHGSNSMANDFQRQIRFLGVESAPAFVRRPEGDGAAERAIRTLKERLLRVRRLAAVEEPRRAPAQFAVLYDATWPRKRRGRDARPDPGRATRSRNRSRHVYGDSSLRPSGDIRIYEGSPWPDRFPGRGSAGGERRVVSGARDGRRWPSRWIGVIPRARWRGSWA